MAEKCEKDLDNLKKMTNINFKEFESKMKSSRQVFQDGFDAFVEENRKKGADVKGKWGQWVRAYEVNVNRMFNQSVSERRKKKMMREE